MKRIENFEWKIIFSEEFLEKNREFYEYCLDNYPDLIFWFSSKSFENYENQRENFYFSGKLETKKIKNIVSNYSWIIYLSNEKFYKKIEEICQKQDNWIEVFLKIDLWKSYWIKFEDLHKMIDFISESENISLVWFSISLNDLENFEKFLEFKNKVAPNSFILTEVEYISEIFDLDKKIDIFII